MGILIPLAVPTAYGVARAAGFDPAAAHTILLGTVSSVLAGAIFGDHCSPISDTTVMSSMSSGCDHVDHVRTQLPYAALVGLVAVALGYLPGGFGVTPWICLPVAGFVLAGLLRWIGRPAAA
jgi:Na+/H+ antiporter NhaC